MQVFGHLLDEEVAEGDAAQALLATGDRIEHRATRLPRVAHDTVQGEDGRDRLGQVVHERHLDEDERLSGESGMEEREAAPVALEPALEIREPADLVYRLVFDQLFQDGGGRTPIDALELEEAAVEPRAQQVGEVVVDGRELR